MIPIATEAQGVTALHEAVMATRPARMPLVNIGTDSVLSMASESRKQVKPPVPAPRVVVIAARWVVSKEPSP